MFFKTRVLRIYGLQHPRFRGTDTTRKKGLTMVHQYKLNGYNIVLDTASGSLHTVDEVAYDIISLYKTHASDEIVSLILNKYSHRDDINENEILECIEDIGALESAGKLFSADPYEDLATNYKNNPLQYSCLENPMDRRTWHATVHRVTKSGP